MACAMKTLTLISSDGKNFKLPEADAALSLTLMNIIDDGCADDPIPLAEVDGETLSEIVKYLAAHSAEKNSAEDKSKFDVEFVAGAGLKVLFNYIYAANYLNIQGLIDISSMKIADLIKNKSVEEVREIFNVANDFTPEEEAEVRKEYEWAFKDVDQYSSRKKRRKMLISTLVEKKKKKDVDQD